MATTLRMEIKRLIQPPMLEVMMEGEVDNPSGLKLLEGAVTEFTGKGVILNMKGVTYLNSAGFGELMEIAQQSAAKGLPMVVTGACEKVRAVFDCLAPGYFKHFAAVDEALEFLK